MAANVNKPTDIKKKEADVNRKLQIYGIFSAFQQGKVPSNDQVDVALNSFLASSALNNPPQQLSDEGKALITDARDVVKQAQHLILSKNQGNLLQDFIWQTEQWDPKSVHLPDAPTNKEAMQKDGEQALQGLRTLGTLLITNGQFRKLLKDSTVLLRDIAGDAATNAAGQVRPSEEELADIDNAAADNTWHETPDLSKEGMRKKAQGYYKGNPKEDARDVAEVGTEAAHPGGANKPADVAATAAVDQAEGTNSGVDANGGAKQAKSALQKKYENKVDPETQQKIRERNEDYRRRAREYLNKKVPQNRRDQTILRLKKMVLECQQHPDYAQAIQTLLDLATQYGKHSKSLSEGGSGSFREARGGIAQAETDLRTLIERFANGTSSEDLWSAIGQIYRDADHDQELRGWFKSMDSYVRRCLLQQGYILEDASNEEWDRLYSQGRFLLRDKYRGHVDRVVDELRFITNEFDNDPQNKRFGESMQKLFTDLGNDKDGKPTFKPHLVKDLTGTIIPAIFENIAYIPVPRIEYSDPQFDAVIENLVLESDNFMPNVLEINSEHHFLWGRKKAATNENKQTFDVRVSGIQMDLRDVSFHIKRKQGFPSITDTGVADFMLGGEGFSFKAKVSTASKHDKQHFFKIDKIDVNIKHMNIKLKQSSHKLLFSLFKPIMMRAMNPAMQRAVEKAIKDQATRADAILFQIKQEADRAQEAARSDPENAPNVYKRYYDAFQKRMLQHKEKAKAAASDKKVNVAMTKEDSIFPDLSLPGGISTKASEYKELARKGERWESPVFSIGKANKSTDIPEAPKIQRKQHGPMKSPKPQATNGPSGAGVGAGAFGSSTDSGYGTTGGSGLDRAPPSGVNLGSPLGGNQVGGAQLGGAQLGGAQLGGSQLGSGGEPQLNANTAPIDTSNLPNTVAAYGTSQAPATGY